MYIICIYLLDTIIISSLGIHVRVYMYIGIGTALCNALLISESSFHMDCIYRALYGNRLPVGEFSAGVYSMLSSPS